jgi:16S rRNA processing protein RimM
VPESQEPWDVVIGRVVKAHGVQGWVRVLPLANAASRLQSLSAFRLCLPTGDLIEGKIEAVRLAGQTALVKLAGLSGRDAAEALVGATLNIQPSMREPLPEGQYYVDQILGLRVMTTDGEDLGVIREVLETGANDVYVTASAHIPAVTAAIEDIDIAGGTMRVHRAAVLIEAEG